MPRPAKWTSTSGSSSCSRRKISMQKYEKSLPDHVFLQIVYIISLFSVEIVQFCHRSEIEFMDIQEEYIKDEMKNLKREMVRKKMKIDKLLLIFCSKPTKSYRFQPNFWNLLLGPRQGRDQASPECSACHRSVQRDDRRGARHYVFFHFLCLKLKNSEIWYFI